MKPKRRVYKFCPDLTKGITCPLCGSAWTCSQYWRKDLNPDGTKKTKEKKK